MTSQGTTETLGSQATQAKEATQQKLSEAGEQARSSLKDQLGQRSSQAGGQVNDMAGSLHAFASQLRDQGKDSQARFADQAANRVDRLGHYLSDSDPDRLLADAERFGRRQPWAVAAGGLVLGIAAARMLKASSQRRYAQTYARDDRSRLGYSDYTDYNDGSRERLEGRFPRDPYEADPYALTRATPAPTTETAPVNTPTRDPRATRDPSVDPSVEETRPVIGEW